MALVTVGFIMFPCILGMNMIPKLFDQKLDHLNGYNADETFKQRWYYNDTFWSGNESLGPFIYQLGGEWTNAGDVVYGFSEEFAQEISGLVITVEHRFYGESFPFDSNTSYIRSSNYLGLLSIEQALADYMELLVYLKDTYFNCIDCPVVVLGGSYSGKMSIYSRLKYPWLYDMALGASAPIFLDSNGIVNPYEYYEIITNATMKISENCVDYIRSGFDVLMSSTPQDITQAIPLCTPLSNDVNKGLYELLAQIYQTFADYSMSNYPPETSPLKYACQRILKGTQNDGLKIWNRFFETSQTNKGCIDLSLYLPAGINATIHCSDMTGCGSGINGESWDYQACTEVIQPIGTNNITDMFPAIFSWNMTWMDEHCMSRFNNITNNKNIKASTRQHWLEKNFGLNPKYFYTKMKYITSNIIFSNGLLDGWSAGGNKLNLSDTLIAINIPNGAHHSDMLPSNVNDTNDIINARNTEKYYLTKWIKQIQTERQSFLKIDL